MSKSKDELLGHAEDNDGIDEFDNPLPDWWVGLFFFTILWAIGYLVDFHYLSDRSQVGWYEAEMAQAAERWPAAEAGVAVTLSPEAVAEGEKIYAQNCVACHSADLSGGIGPNLVDTEWIHGGSPEEIMATITDGVPAKGMLSWGPILGPDKIAKVTAYVVSRGEGH